MEYKSFMEALKGNQHKLDKNKNGKLDAHDFKLLRKEEEELDEAYGVNLGSRPVSGQKEYQGKEIKSFHPNKEKEAREYAKKHGYVVKKKELPKGSSNITHTWDIHKEEVELDEADIQARADYKLDKSGRKYHKQIHFKDGSNDEANEKNEVREETDMNEEMTDAQKAERERLVKGMKKNLAGFKAKYGERAKEVMYATATKQAMKEESDLTEESQKHIVNVTVSDPNHTMVSKRKETIQKRATVTAKSRESAVDTALNHYKKQGYKVHDHTYVGLKEENMNEEQLDERNKENATRRKMMDASRGARWKVQNKVSADDVRDWDGKHKTAQAQNKAIGRALRNEEADNLDEALDPSEIAGNPRMYDAVTVKKAYYHKKASTSDKESLARHLDRHHGNKDWRKPVKEEMELEEGIKTVYHKFMAKRAGKKADDAYDMGDEKEFQKQVDKSEYHRVKAGGKPTRINTNPDSKWLTTREEFELDEAVESGNKGYGYHGQHESDVADKKYSAMHAKVKKVAGEAGHLRDAKKPNVMVKHYLDSRHGRHLAGNEHDHEYIKKDFGKFKKSYKESDFAKESVGFDEEGNLMAEKLTYAQFMEQLLEYTPGPGGVTRVQGRSYGAQYHDPEGDDDADDKPKKKAEPAVKRGRGRPAGSKSGANQKVTSGKSYGGIATHSLHLPSSNR